MMSIEWALIEDNIRESKLQQQLYSLGYVVCDGLWPASTAAAFRDEVLSLYGKKLMKPNQVQFNTSSVSLCSNATRNNDFLTADFQGAITLTKPSVYEADLHDGSIKPETPMLSQLLDQGERLHQVINQLEPRLELELESSCKHRTVKLQYNQGWSLSMAGCSNGYC